MKLLAGILRSNLLHIGGYIFKKVPAGKENIMRAALVILGIAIYLSIPQYIFYLYVGATAPYHVAVGPLTIVWWVINLFLVCIYMIFWGCDKA